MVRALLAHSSGSEQTQKYARRSRFFGHLPTWRGAFDSTAHGLTSRRRTTLVLVMALSLPRRSVLQSTCMSIQNVQTSQKCPIEISVASLEMLQVKSPAGGIHRNVDQCTLKSRKVAISVKDSELYEIVNRCSSKSRRIVWIYSKRPGPKKDISARIQEKTSGRGKEKKEAHPSSHKFRRE